MRNNDKQLREALASWLNRYHWDWFCTLSFNLPVKDTITAKRHFKRWIDKDVQPYVAQSVRYFVCVERFSHWDGCHLHSLVSVGYEDTLYGRMNYLILPFWNAWRRGHGAARIVLYEPYRGAIYYLTKYVTKDIYDWDIKLN